ncbi:glutaminyl-tRNA synthetase [Formosa agariphila KMM 3901]|uniref:Glutaminyl-tRNA synthetase n=1 Tax=Formosa agariphila (strain DSM 15362 / KCTC 12365 / LMG 23005 / KMM 3901 / M-2Alg 35-1) TaxID=1347342 RepID=T2KMT4_FORAG|nr:hypothetical protein [Formosa agariphila]CDF79741.1 glutaminyl-tRNA synthetase [Formosa agariphila KMM 3901]
MKKVYNSFDEINYELKRLDLERKIAWEELKGLKGDVKEDLQPLNWVQTALSYTAKIGSFVMFKKFMK